MLAGEMCFWLRLHSEFSIWFSDRIRNSVLHTVWVNDFKLKSVVCALFLHIGMYWHKGQKKTNTSTEADHIWSLSLSLTTTRSSCWMLLSHSDCPLVVCCVQSTYGQQWWESIFQLNIWLVKGFKYKVVCTALKHYVNLVPSGKCRTLTAKGRRRLPHVVHWPAQQAKPSLPSPANHLDALPHFWWEWGKIMCIIHPKDSMIWRL